MFNTFIQNTRLCLCDAFNANQYFILLAANCVVKRIKPEKASTRFHTEWERIWKAWQMYLGGFLCIRFSLNPIFMFQSATFACIKSHPHKRIIHFMRYMCSQYNGYDAQFFFLFLWKITNYWTWKSQIPREILQKACINRIHKRRISNTNTKESKCGVWHGALARKKATKEWEKKIELTSKRRGVCRKKSRSNSNSGQKIRYVS